MDYRPWKNEAFEDRISVKAEGLYCQKLVSECLARKIYVRDIRYLDELAIMLTIPKNQYKAFLALARNRYIITEIDKKGPRFLFQKIFSKKSFLLGFGLFLLLIFYQSQFVSEVFVDGLETISKDDFYEVLKENGLYEGAYVGMDVPALKERLYIKLGGEINWINVKINGTKALVEVVEKAAKEAEFDYKKPCDIVAKKDGYILKFTAKNGTSLVRIGQSVTKGQKLVSGETTGGGVHALGDFYARVIYHFNVYQDRYEVIKKETGRNIYGVRIKVGAFDWNSYYLFNGFDRADEHKYSLVNFDGGKIFADKGSKYFGGGSSFPIVIELLDYKEITATKREREKEEIAIHMKKIIRDKLKAEMPKSAIILTQNLKYDATMNTVKVTVDLQTMEQIGMEKML